MTVRRNAGHRPTAMSFCTFSFKYKKRAAKVYDDRPFSSLVKSSDKERLVTSSQLVQSEEDEDIHFNPSTSYDFMSFNHYFDEPIYTEPDSKEVSHVCDDGIKVRPRKTSSPKYDMMTITAGTYHCKALSSDSDYESYSLEKMDVENSAGRNQ